MANDVREEERQFLAGLKTRTGRGLAEWMAAITAQGSGDKNDIIDWLRGEGLPFARASWLERIHRNGGKPIYADAAPAPPPAAPEVQRSEVRAGEPEPRTRPRPRPRQQSGLVASASKAKEVVPKPVQGPANAAAELEKLVSTAKGYRPLYHMLEAQIRQAVPGVAVSPQGRYVSFGAPNELAAVTLHPTEVRLGLDLGDRPFDAVVQQAKMRGPGPAITHMIVLTDARQVDERLLALVRAAHHRVNGAGQ
jgi:hypothetical protein